MRKFLLLSLILTSCLCLTGCINYASYKTELQPDACVMSAKKYFNTDKISLYIYCIDGIQYVFSGGLSPYIDSQTNGYRRCTCEN